jgi:hypothetical protein
MEEEKWIGYYDNLEDSYIPGDTLPPCKEEWRFRYYKYFWKVSYNPLDAKKRYLPVITATRPILKDGAFGFFNDQTNTWTFIPITHCRSITVTKQRIKGLYRLVGKQYCEEFQKEQYVVEFKETEPVDIPDTKDWGGDTIGYLQGSARET